MGLDMYLRAEKYITDYDFYKPEEREKYRAVITALNARDIADPDTPSAEVSVTVAYWRKANQIHRWFVENVQEGVDDCKPYYVSRGQLEELRATCRRVLDSITMIPGTVHEGTTYHPGGKVEEHRVEGEVVFDTEVAEELLPAQEGFFFGGTDYDQWYVEDLRNTVTQLDRALSAPEGWTFEYQSSW